MSLTTFSGQTPPWNLAALDSNFAQLNTTITAQAATIAAQQSAITALQNAASPTSFTCAATGAYVGSGGSVTLSYITFGSLVWLYVSHDILANSNLGTSFAFTQLPPAITPSSDQYIGVPAYFFQGSFGNFLSCQIVSATGVLNVFYNGALPANTLFGFAKGLMLNYVIQ